MRRSRSDAPPLSAMRAGDGASGGGAGGGVVTMLEQFIGRPDECGEDGAAAERLRKRASTTVQRRRSTTMQSRRGSANSAITPRVLVGDFDPTSPTDGGVDEVVRMLREELEQREEELQLAGAVGQLLLGREAALKAELAEANAGLERSDLKMQELLADHRQLDDMVLRARSASSSRDRAASDEVQVKIFQARLERAENAVAELTQENLRLTLVVSESAKVELSEQTQVDSEKRRRRASVGRSALVKSPSSASLQCRVTELEELLKQAELETQAERNRRAELSQRDVPSSATRNGEGVASAAIPATHSQRLLRRPSSASPALRRRSSRDMGGNAPALRSLFAEARNAPSAGDGGPPGSARSAGELVSSAEFAPSEGKPRERVSTGEALTDILAAELAAQMERDRPGEFGGRIGAESEETGSAANAAEVWTLRENVAALTAEQCAAERKMDRLRGKFEDVVAEHDLMARQADSAQRSAEHWQTQHRTVVARCRELDEIVATLRSSTHRISFDGDHSLSPQHRSGHQQRSPSSSRSSLVRMARASSGLDLSAELSAAQCSVSRGATARSPSPLSGGGSKTGTPDSSRRRRTSADIDALVDGYGVESPEARSRVDSPAEDMTWLRGGMGDSGEASAALSRRNSEPESLGGLGFGADARAPLSAGSDSGMVRAESEFDLAGILEDEAVALEREDELKCEIAELQENARVVAEAMASKHFRAQEQYRRLSTMVSAGITQDGLRECVRAARVIAVTLSNGAAATDGTKFGIGLHAVYHIKVVTGISINGLSPTRSDADGRPRFAGGVKEWQIERRFSDFRFLHLALSRK